jgi:hypothetical protein
MNSLVIKSLRDYAAGARNWRRQPENFPTPTVPPDLLDEAANLIESLGAAIERRRAAMHEMACEGDAKIGRLRAALRECGAPFDTGPTTIASAAEIIADEFERRLNIAANALNDGTVPAPAENVG